MTKVKVRVSNDETEPKSLKVFNSKHFFMEWTVEPLEDFAEKMQKKIEAHTDWETPLQEEIIKKMKYKPVGEGEVLNLKKLRFRDTVEAMQEAFVRITELNTESRQKKLPKE